VLKGTLEAGEGDETPQSGDLVRAALRGAPRPTGTLRLWLQPNLLPTASALPCLQVFLHYSLLNEHRDVLCSTHQEHGGSGRPQPFVIGRGRRMLRGMELGVQGMQA
jgi:hypothetical protein